MCCACDFRYLLLLLELYCYTYLLVNLPLGCLDVSLSLYTSLYSLPVCLPTCLFFALWLTGDASSFSYSFVSTIQEVGASRSFLPEYWAW